MNFVRNTGGQVNYYPIIYLGLRDNSVNITVTAAEFRTGFFFRIRAYSTAATPIRPLSFVKVAEATIEKETQIQYYGLMQK